MSVKFEKETVTKSVEGLAGAAADQAGKGKDDLLKNVGEAVTKGGGVNGYLTVSGPAPLRPCCARLN